ncbi:MAG: 30S ribosomal protein S27ae [Promethearchaeota archaeon]
MNPRRNPTKAFYEIDYKKGTIKRTHKFCPRCKGSFMARHKDRISCGLCGYSEF